MIPKSGDRFSDKIMLKKEDLKWPRIGWTLRPRRCTGAISTPSLSRSSPSTPATPSRSRRCRAARLSAEAGLGPDGAARAAGDPRQGAGQARRPAHLTGPVAVRGAKAGPGAGSPHQGDRAALRLGLQHHPAARRRAARRLQDDAPIHIPLDKQRMTGKLPWGLDLRSQAVLRRHGGGAAGRLGHDQLAAAAAQRRQYRQQGAGRRHDALSADPHRRRAVLLRRRPRRAGRRRGLHHRDRDRADRHLRADRARRHGRSNGRWPRRRRT